MADVKIIDIDGERWNIKDLSLTERVAKLENIGTVISDNMVFNCNISNQYNFGGYVTIPKGTWLAMFHMKFNQGTSIKHLLMLDSNELALPTSPYIQIDGANCGNGQINCVLQSDGTKRIRPYIFNYGEVSSELKATCSYSLVKLHD